MKEARITWDKFSGGEAGLEGLANPTRESTFSGRNVLVYADGSVGPRPGLRRIPLTTPMPGASCGLHSPTSTGFTAVTYDLSTTKLYFGQFKATGEVVFHLSITEATDQVRDSDVIMASDGLWRFTYGAKLYKTSDAGPITVVSGFPSSTYYQTPLIESAGVLVAGVGTTLRYSSPSNFDSWPATSFIDLKANITALEALGDDLIIFTSDGVFALVGAIGTASSRMFRLSDKVGADSLNDTAATPDFVYIWPAKSTHPVILDAGRPTPVGFLEASSKPALGGSLSPDQHGVAAAEGTKGVSACFLASYPDLTGAQYRRATLLHNDSWTQHELDAEVTADIAGDQGTERLFVIAGKGVSAGSTTYYTFSPALADRPGETPDTANAAVERPGLATDRFRLPGDDSLSATAATFDLPEVWSDDGEVSVRQIIVDFTTWETGGASANELVCDVTTFGRTGTDGEGVNRSTWSNTSEFTGSANLLNFTASQMETSGGPDGSEWSAGPNTSVLATEALRLTAIAAGTTSASLKLPIYGIQPGNVYNVSADFYTAVTARTVEVVVDWYSLTNLLLSSNTSPGSTDAVAPVIESFAPTAPAGAASAKVRLRVLGPASGEVHYVSNVQFTGLSPAGPTRRRAIFNQAAAQPGGGFQVSFPSLKGAAIRSVTAITLTNGDRPRR